MQQNDPAQPQNNEEDVQMMNADESDQPEQENPILPASVEPAEKLIKRFDNFGFRIQKLPYNCSNFIFFLLVCEAESDELSAVFGWFPRIL